MKTSYIDCDYYTDQLYIQGQFPNLSENQGA